MMIDQDREHQAGGASVHRMAVRARTTLAYYVVHVRRPYNLLDDGKTPNAQLTYFSKFFDFCDLNAGYCRLRKVFC